LPFDDKLPNGARRWLGGWQTSAIVTFRTGLPFSILSGTPTPNGVTNNRINDVADTIIRQPGAFRSLLPASGLNLTARDANFVGTRVIPGYVSGSGNFTAPTTIGTLGRNTERGDRYSDVSFGLHKDFTITERLRSQFRVEAFNLFNTVNYDVYVNSLANPAFGTATSVYGQRSVQLALRLTF
jgi:hypothetical protein